VVQERLTVWFPQANDVVSKDRVVLSNASPDPAQCVKPTALGTTFSLIFHLRAAAGVQAKEQNILMDETTQSHIVYFSS